MALSLYIYIYIRWTYNVLLSLWRSDLPLALHFRPKTGLSRSSRASSLREAPTTSPWKSSADRCGRTAIALGQAVSVPVVSTDKEKDLAQPATATSRKPSPTLEPANTRPLIFTLPRRGPVEKGGGWRPSARRCPAHRRR